MRWHHDVLLLWRALAFGSATCVAMKLWQPADCALT